MRRTIRAEPNMLFTADNLHVLTGMDSESIDMVYLDPPFNSKRLYKGGFGTKAANAAFKDMWTWTDVDEQHLETMVDQHPCLVGFIASVEGIHGKAMKAYVTYIAQRLIELHRVLKPTGSLYLHCDPTANSYLRITLDKIFGPNAFRNEIAWCYRGMPSKANKFQQKHDTILFYGKTKEAKFHTLEGEPTEASQRTFANAEKRGFNANLKKKMVTVWDWNKYEAAVKDGTLPDNLQPTEFTGGKPPLADWWDMPILAPTSKERTGWPTQKPLALVTRTILASTDPGDVVMDPFCGCATTLVAAEHTGRKWIGIDVEKAAAAIIVERLADEQGGLFRNFTHTEALPLRTDVERVVLNGNKKRIKQRLLTRDGEKCQGCGLESVENLEIDHRLPKSKGGQDCMENYQLLCGACNRIKGDRPMEYLNAKLEKRRESLNQISFGF